MQRRVVVETTGGKVNGVCHRGVCSFLGVPYGASTSGPARFHPPEVAKPWVGVRDATVFGPAAPQNDIRLAATGSWVEAIDYVYPRTGGVLEGIGMGEDCLVLNVWTPDAHPASARPVMVWLHGGGYQHGAGSESMFLGDRLADIGDVVVVTLNHRLGIMGYLALDAILPEQFPHAGSAGLLDIVLALEWVRDNIEAFGGDPTNMTLFGQSGGADKVRNLMTMPRAAGLFHKAVMQSWPGMTAVSAGVAEQLAERVLRLAGLTRERAHELTALSFEQLLDLQARVSGDVMGGFTLEGGLLDAGQASFAPYRGEGDQPATSGGEGEVPLLIGSTTHDASLILCNASDYATLTEQQLQGWIAAKFDTDAPSVAERYEVHRHHEPARLRLARIFTDLTFGRAAANLAAQEAQRRHVFAYEFAYETPILDRLLGATHSLDLPFVFHTAEMSPFAGDRPNRQEVSSAMAHAWTTFARTGWPGHDGIPAWEGFTTSSRATMRIDTEWTLQPGHAPSDLPGEMAS